VSYQSKLELHKIWLCQEFIGGQLILEVITLEISTTPSSKNLLSDGSNLVLFVLSSDYMDIASQKILQQIVVKVVVLTKSGCFGNTAYTVISKIILLREKLKDYVMDQMKLAASNGVPVLRPMFFDFPKDPRTYTAEDQYMFGPDWLVAPVTQYQAKSRTVYLPTLPNGQVWTNYYTNQDSTFGQVTVPTPIDSFPLFFRRSTKVTYVPATQYHSAERNDSVLCVSQQCLQANCAGCGGNYVSVRVEGYTVENSASGTVPLNLWYSNTLEDNYVTTGTVPPDNSYSVKLTDGQVFSQNGQGMIPLDLFYNPQTKHHITVASAEGHQWAKDNGFTFVQNQGYIYTQMPSQ